MDLLLPISGTLISLEAGANGNVRRRLCLSHTADPSSETPVRVNRITVLDCFVACGEALPRESAQTWLKLPDMAPLRVFVEPEPEGGLKCTFVQPLSRSERENLVVPAAHRTRHFSRPEPRCTFF